MDGLGEHYSAVPYAALHGPDEAPESSSSLRVLALALSAVVFVSLGAMLTGGPEAVPEQSPRRVDARAHLVLPLSRGKAAGVSEKSSEASAFMGSTRYSLSWTHAMLQWQRTAFHFQPEKNWMNDPNGPVYHRGWYHLFYQYNPKGAVWGNIAWGHAVSRDLVNWLHLPLAMVPDQWYDANGVFTGSATILPDGKLVMLYTGSSNDFGQVQCLAVPADPNDPLLLNWTKSDANPVLVPPPGIGRKDFRDPTTAWWDADDSAWRVIIGSKDENHEGISIVYRTRDFVSYERLPGVLHAVPRTGMWECVDFYPVAMAAEAGGLDTSTSPGEGLKHVLKASMDDDRHDYYAIGKYEAKEGRWVADDPEADVGLGLRYDWGKFYASKTFYDQAKGRRVLWGWVGETDSELADVQKGWASLQGIPRTVLYDNKTGSNLLQWPVEEVENLRTSSDAFTDIEIHAGSELPLNVSSATQLDIEAVFQISASALAEAMDIQIEYNCSTSGGAASRGALGPFGLLVLANSHFSEQTAVYFYVSRRPDGDLSTHLCHDETRSSQANDIVKRVVGSTVPVLDGEKLSVRILVDHTIVESFAQGGRTCITSRVYPTKAIYREAGVFLFNNATDACVTAKSIKIWQMNSAILHPYPFQA